MLNWIAVLTVIEELRAVHVIGAVNLSRLLFARLLK